MRPIIVLLFVYMVCPLWVTAQQSLIDSLQAALKIKQISYEEKVNTLSNIGTYYKRTQIYPDSAFFYTEQAYLLAKEHKLENLQARTLFNLGSIHNTISDFEKSIEYYEKAKIVIEKLELRGPLNGVINNIGGNYFQLQKYQTAITYYKEALGMATADNDAYSMGIDHMNIGEAYYMLGDLDKAKENLELALEALEKAAYDPTTVHLFYARTLWALEQNEQAILEAEKSLEIAEASNDLFYISEASELLSMIHAEKEDYKNAYNYHEKFARFSDSLNVAQEENEIEKLKLNFQLKEQKEELVYISKRNEYQNIIYILIATGILLLVVLIFRQRKIVRMTRNIHDIQQRLVAQELDERIWKSENPNATAFEAAQQQE